MESLLFENDGFFFRCLSKVLVAMEFQGKLLGMKRNDPLNKRIPVSSVIPSKPFHKNQQNMKENNATNRKEDDRKLKGFVAFRAKYCKILFRNVFVSLLLSFSFHLPLLLFSPSPVRASSFFIHLIRARSLLGIFPHYSPLLTCRGLASYLSWNSLNIKTNCGCINFYVNV